jgi:hypothetical protein
MWLVVLVFLYYHAPNGYFAAALILVILGVLGRLIFGRSR